MSRLDPLQALGSMAEQWNKNTDKLLTLAVGMTLHRLGVPQVSFTVVELEEFSRTHLVTKEHADTPRGLEWTVKVLPMNAHPGQSKFNFHGG